MDVVHPSGDTPPEPCPVSRVPDGQDTPDTPPVNAILGDDFGDGT